MVATHSINVAATHSTGHASLGALLRGGGGALEIFCFVALYICLQLTLYMWLQINRVVTLI